MWQGHNKWQQIMWREISRDLDRHHNDVLRRYGRIQRRLDHHDRTLQYLARRLS
jgi:exonuclease V gamma subunit